MDAQLADAPVLDLKGQHGFYEVKALASAGSGVEVEDPQLVAFRLDYVGMAKDQQIGLFRLKLLFNLRRENMGQPDPYSLALKVHVFRKAVAHGAVVDVAVTGQQRSPGGQLIGDVEPADVSGVPDFIAITQDSPPLWVKMSVSIREQADPQGSSCSWRPWRCSAMWRSRLRR